MIGAVGKRTFQAVLESIEARNRRRDPAAALLARLRRLAERGVHQAAAARRLGVSVTTVARYARRYGLQFGRFDWAANGRRAQRTQAAKERRYKFTDADRAKSGRSRADEPAPVEAPSEEEVRARRQRAVEAACRRAGVPYP